MSPTVPRHPAPESTRHGRRRVVSAILAATVLSGIVVVAPSPTVVSASLPEVRTERVELAPRHGDRAGDRLAPVMAADAHSDELRTALEAPTGRRTTRRAASAFHAIGVTLPAAPTAPVLVRARVAGSWTPWTEVEFASGEAPDHGTEPSRPGAHSEPIWMGDADAYELDGPAAVGAVDVHLVGDGPGGRSVALTDPTAGAAGAPAILGRAAWSARPPSIRPSISQDLKAAVVHHSVNGNAYSSADVPQLLRSIQAYHQNVQGWNDIAYNFAVDRFGRVWEGRAGGTDRAVVGGHAQGFNTGTTGVVVLGDFTSSAAPAASVEAVARVVAWKFALHAVNPASTVPLVSAGSSKYSAGTTVTLPRVIGHRDVQSTGCPGAGLYNRMGTIRARVALLVPSYQQGLSPQVLATDTTGDGRLEPIEYRPGATEDAQWVISPTGRLTRSPLSIRGAYRPAVGDFDGDGRTDVLWHASGSAGDPMWWAGAAGPSTRYVTVNGSYLPVTGDFDGNGVDDVFWYAPGTATDHVWYFERDRSWVSTPVREDLITGIPLVGDFDGSGTDDIFFYGPGSADDRLWRSTGRAWTRTSPAVSGWYEPVTLDATGEGRTDILWFAPGSTTSYRWDFNANGTAVSRTLTTAPLAGDLAVGDFDGDGREDTIVVGPRGAADQVWYSTPTGIEARPMVADGTFTITAGAMDVDPGPALTDDVLFVPMTGAAYLWHGLPARTFTATRSG